MACDSPGGAAAIASARANRGRRLTLRRLSMGFAVGVLLSGLGHDLGVGDWPVVHYLGIWAMGGALGAALMVSRYRRALWAIAYVAVLLVAFVAVTPAAGRLVHTLDRRDPLRKAPAVVVLSTDVFTSGGLPFEAESRVLRAFELLAQGYAPVLVTTRVRPPARSSVPEVTRQMRALGLSFPVLETEGVLDTHDEAIAVAKLARVRGWREVILVTHPWHMRRAAAVFSKAGVHVICAPCDEQEFDYRHIVYPRQRIAAFARWIHEVIGYQYYRLRGWI